MDADAHLGPASLYVIFAANAWRWATGRTEMDTDTIPPLVTLQHTEWSKEFETLMRNRLIMGRARYGTLRDAGTRNHRRVQRAQLALTAYETDGNPEHLVDAANLCMVQFAASHTVDDIRSSDDRNHTWER